jgi:hypothetical protein
MCALTNRGTSWVYGSGKSPPFKGASMAKTGEINTVAGIYQSTDVCNERVTMPIGHKFPDCPKCKKSTSYRLVEATKR